MARLAIAFTFSLLLIACSDDPPISGMCEELPTSGDACSNEADQCTYEEVCCCGSCQPSIVCDCNGGAWTCYSTEACRLPMCGDTGPDTSVDTGTLDSSTTDSSTIDSSTADSSADGAADSSADSATDAADDAAADAADGS